MGVPLEKGSEASRLVEMVLFAFQKTAFRSRAEDRLAVKSHFRVPRANYSTILGVVQLLATQKIRLFNYAFTRGLVMPSNLVPCPIPQFGASLIFFSPH